VGAGEGINGKGVLHPERKNKKKNTKRVRRRARKEQKGGTKPIV